ncbi:MAG: peptide ABC transporter substrate-binding protein [Phycisphaerae bacterium]|nr:peptide ABC transporter substrate-binding protein [Phycisphaerae bacterium]
MPRRLLLPVALLAVALAIAAIADRPLPRADAVLINRGDATTLDPQSMSWLQDFRVAKLIYEGLVRQDPFTPDYRILPGVATSWDVSPDRLTYTFHLRTEASWSNGRPVVAADFIHAWRRALLPDTAADFSGMLFHLRGARDFYAWRARALAEFAASPPADRAAERLWAETLARFDATVGARAQGDHTLVVTLARPVPYFLDLCAFPALFPVCAPIVRAHEHIDPDTARLRTDPAWTKPPTLPCNGPFEVTAWRFKRDMRLAHNSHYWDPARTNVDTIAIPSIDDANAQVLAFATGAVDWVSDVTTSYRGDMLAAKAAFRLEHAAAVEAMRAQGVDEIEIDRRLPDDPRAHIHVLPAFGTYFYNFNCSPRLGDGRANPFADARVRRAFALALDKRTIAQTVRRAGEPETATLIPPGSIAGYQSPRGLPRDVARAREELASAGFPGGRGLPTVELLFNKDGGHDLIAQAAAACWERELGVSVRLVQREIKVFREDLKNGNFMVSRAGWYGDYGDPMTFLEPHRTGDGNNDRQYSSAEYDALLDKAADEPDPAARLAILGEAERVLVERDLPLLPIFRYNQVMLFNAHRVSGVTPHPRQDQILDRLDILGDGKGAERALTMSGGTEARTPGSDKEAQGSAGEGARRGEP